MVPSPEPRAPARVVLVALVALVIAATSACEGAAEVATPTPAASPSLALAAAPGEGRGERRRARREEKRAREAGEAGGAGEARGRTPTPTPSSQPSTTKSTPTPSTLPACPPNSPLTYRSFGGGFLRTWCTGCHSSTLPEPERQGAPEGIDFDRPEGLIELAESIHDRAVVEVDHFIADPTGNASPMPPAGVARDEDRRRLAIWLACGLPGVPRAK